MSVSPTAYPIVLRVVKGYIEASQPDLEIYRVRGRFDDLKRREEIGAVVMDVWNEIIERVKHIDARPPSTPKTVLKQGHKDALAVGPASAVLGVSIATVRRMCEAGKLESFRTPGGRWKIKVTDPTMSRFLVTDETN